MLYFQTYTCKKCGKGFTKTVGGIIMTPREMELALHPVCDRCRLNTITSIFTGKR